MWLTAEIRSGIIHKLAIDCKFILGCLRNKVFLMERVSTKLEFSSSINEVIK